MLKTVGGKRADFSGREPGINVPAPRMLKNKQFSPSVQFIFSACLIDSSIIILFSTFVRASGHRFTCPGELMAPSHPYGDDTTLM
jgi:hypothetical protein